MQEYLYELLAEINAATPAGCARYLPGGAPPRTGDVVTDPELADALQRFGAEGPAHFYTGDVAAAVVDEVRAQGGLIRAADLAAYEQFLRQKLTQVAGVSSIESSFSLGQVKSSRVLPI